jgi:hypothetical protein
MIENLHTFQRTYDFVVWLYHLLNKLPRNHRPLLGHQIHTLALTILVGVIEANTERDIDARLILQQKISRDLDTLRILIRLTKDVRLMSIKQYTFAVNKMNEIGRLLQGWMRAK